MARAADRTIPAGTFVGIIGHIGLALGFIVLSLMETVRTDLLGYLFGDVLALTDRDVIAIAAVGTLVLIATALIWKPLLRVAVGGPMAAAEGHHRPLAQAGFLILTAVLVAFGLKVVGALLIVALLIIPPAAARPLAKSPEAMALWAAALGAVSVPLGLGASLAVDAPAGPAIVLAAGGLFALSMLYGVIAEAVARHAISSSASPEKAR